MSIFSNLDFFESELKKIDKIEWNMLFNLYATIS